jgi:hypothetical protein
MLFSQSIVNYGKAVPRLDHLQCADTFPDNKPQARLKLLQFCTLLVVSQEIPNDHKTLGYGKA